MKRALLVFALALGVLLLVLVTRAFLLDSRQEPAAPGPAVSLDEGALAARLAAAVRFPTISHQDPAKDDPAAMAGLRQYLAATYPKAFAALHPGTIGGGALLFTWDGSESAEKPIVLLSHMDVVPISPGTEKDWLHPPFSGDIADGYVWGRGTLDDKSGVLGLLEAAEHLLGEGFKPKRTIYLAFGCDEEVGGNRGAGEVSKVLVQRGVHADYVLDEGGLIAVGLLGGLAKPAALIGIAEKGYVSVELTAEGEGGHSSAPPEHTAIGRLSRAVARLEAHPMPRGVKGALKGTLLAVGPDMGFAQRLAIANLWLFEPLLTRLLGQGDATRALLMTTQATTIFQSGDKDNVLPGKARAVVNFRLLPGDTVEGVLAHVKEAIDDDGIELATLPGAKAASPLSPDDTPSFKALARVVRGTYPATLAAPYLTIGGTDSIHYEVLSPNVYRFLPAHFGPDDVARFHGTNERLGVKDYADTVRFFVRLMKETAG